MSLKVGNVAPNFTADTTQGMINFYEWMGNSWTIFLSHPKDCNQVCTTELIWLSQNLELFKANNIKIISLSLDKLIQQGKWLDDIKHTHNIMINTPLISDKSMRIAKLYNMIHSVDDINTTARSLYIISPEKKIVAMFTYPVQTARNFTEVVRILELLTSKSFNLEFNIPGYLSLDSSDKNIFNITNVGLDHDLDHNLDHTREQAQDYGQSYVSNYSESDNNLNLDFTEINVA